MPKGTFMRPKTLLAVLTLAMLAAGCTGEKSALVDDSSAAPYYTSLAEAQSVATEGQFIVAEFYTDT